jgi:hypothetical protein
LHAPIAVARVQIVGGGPHRLRERTLGAQAAVDQRLVVAGDVTVAAGVGIQDPEQRERLFEEVPHVGRR